MNFPAKMFSFHFEGLKPGVIFFYIFKLCYACPYEFIQRKTKPISSMRHNVRPVIMKQRHD